MATYPISLVFKFGTVSLKRAAVERALSTPKSTAVMWPRMWTLMSTPASTARVVGIAAASRLGLLLLCVAADTLLWDHVPDVSVAAYAAGSPLTRAFTRWDSARFLAIIDNWYDVTLDAYAFFPGFPGAARALKRLAEHLGGLSLGADGSIICGLVVSNTAFVLSAVSLKFLTQAILLKCPTGLLNRAAGHAASQHARDLPSRCRTDAAFVNITLAAYVLNPASVFFVTNYSESLFACLTFSGMLYLERQTSDIAGGGKLSLPSSTAASFILAAGTCTRANGILACILVAAQPVCHQLRRILKSFQPEARGCRTARGPARPAGLFAVSMLSCAAIASPYFGFQLYGYRNVCPQGLETNLPEPVNACHSFGPLSLYAHIQQTGWNNGLFRYWQLRQLPNFLLASPMFACTFAGAWAMFRAGTTDAASPSTFGKCGCWNCRLTIVCSGHEQRSKPGARRATEEGLSHTVASMLQLLDEDAVAKYFVHWFVLAGFILLCGHVQIVTRAVCASSPALYWFVAEAAMCHRTLHLPNAGEEDGPPRSRLHFLAYAMVSRLRLYRRWCVSYICLGILLHCNSLPWT